MESLILALRVWLDRETNREIRYSETERETNRKRYRKMNI